MNHTKYITTEGERWDNIAWAAYADVARMPDIIAANPDVPVYAVLPGGLELKIPIIADNAPVVNPDNLPPWKR